MVIIPRALFMKGSTMSAYVIIRTDTKTQADVLASYLLAAALPSEGYEIADGETLYYTASEVCEDISKIITIVKKAEDEE